MEVVHKSMNMAPLYRCDMHKSHGKKETHCCGRFVEETGLLRRHLWGGR